MKSLTVEEVFEVGIEKLREQLAEHMNSDTAIFARSVGEDGETAAVLAFACGDGAQKLWAAIEAVGLGPNAPQSKLLTEPKVQ